MSKVVIDAFGGDNAPIAPIKGAIMAREKFNIDVILCGNEVEINRVAKETNIDISGIEIINADDVFDMHDKPEEILKSKNNTSMAVAFKALAEGKADAFVSAGSTGAVLMGGTFICKRIKGVKRAAIGSVIPTPDSFYFMLDCGANADCRPEMLYSFGIMGYYYSKLVLNVDNPKVGLLNIGTEDTKGGELQLGAYKLLSEDKSINFIGNVEARDVPMGACDVLVADGFTGNVVLKLTEGVATTFFKMIKGIFSINLKTKISALLMKKNLYGLKTKFDYSEFGGAPLLGIKYPVIKAHGSSDEKAIMNAIRIADEYHKSDAIGKMETVFNELRSNND